MNEILALSRELYKEMLLELVRQNRLYGDPEGKSLDEVLDELAKDDVTDDDIPAVIANTAIVSLMMGMVFHNLSESFKAGIRESRRQ